MLQIKFVIIRLHAMVIIKGGTQSNVLSMFPQASTNAND